MDLKQSTGVTAKIGPFLDDTDGKTAETGLTIAQADVRLAKNGGNIAQKHEATSCTHDELGYYNCPLDTTDTATLGRLKLIVHASGALPVWHDFNVISANEFDHKYGATVQPVNVTQLGGVAQSLADLKDLADTGYNPATHTVQVRGLYGEGAVWIDTVNGTAGTTSYVHGIPEVPVDNIDDANTLAAALNLSTFKVAPGSTITFVAAQENQRFEAQGTILALGGQSISGSTFTGAVITGTSTGSATFVNCAFANTTLAGGAFNNCTFAGTITMSGAANYIGFGCNSALAAGACVFDFGAAVGNTGLLLHHFGGGLTVANMGQSGTDVLEVGGVGLVTLQDTCVGGTAHLYGMLDLADSSSGVTINQDSRYALDRILADKTAFDGADIPAVALATGTTLPTHFTDIKGTGFVKDTNSLVNMNSEAPLNLTVQATVDT